MVKVPLSYKFILFFNYIFLKMYFSFSILYLHSYSMIFKNILSSLSFLFFPSSSFSFLFFPHFPFVHFFFFPIFLFFLFSQFASFPQSGLPFPKSAAPVLPHFLLPWCCVSTSTIFSVFPLPLHNDCNIAGQDSAVWIDYNRSSVPYNGDMYNYYGPMVPKLLIIV